MRERSRTPAALTNQDPQHTGYRQSEMGLGLAPGMDDPFPFLAESRTNGLGLILLAAPLGYCDQNPQGCGNTHEGRELVLSSLAEIL